MAPWQSGCWTCPLCNSTIKHMLDVTVAHLRAPGVLDASVDIAGSAIPKVISRKHRRYR